MSLIKKGKNRIIEIDFIRGVLILFMVVDHFFFDFMSGSIFEQIFAGFTSPIASTANWYWNWDLRVNTRLAILSLFFVISGISTYFSKSNLKRSLILIGVGGLIDLAFFIIDKFFMGDSGDMLCFFGAISCFGFSILIFYLINLLFKKVFKSFQFIIKYLNLIIGIIIIFVGIFSFKVFGFNGGPEYAFDVNWNNWFKVVIGICEPRGADWLPLFPYMGFLFVGSFIGEFLYKERISYFLPFPKKEEMQEPTYKRVIYYGGIVPFKGFTHSIAFVGKYTIFVYILHQPVIILITGIILLCMGYRLSL